MRISACTWVLVILGVAAGGCRRSQTGAAADAAVGPPKAGAPADAGPSSDVSQDGTPTTVAADAPPDGTSADGGAEAEAPPKGGAEVEPSADAAPEPPADPFCPRPLGENDALSGALWPTIERQLRTHYRIAAGSTLTEGERTVVAVATGEDGVAVAAAYGIDRFSMWRRGLSEREWEAAEARRDAASRREHARCLAHPPDETDHPEEACANWLEPGEFDYDVVAKIWEGISPAAPINDDCTEDGLAVALFTGRLDERGQPDPASLQLTGTVTVQTENRCGPFDPDARFVDLDRDGALEFVVATGPSWRHQIRWKRIPEDLNVLRLDLTVQHHQLFAGIGGDPMDDSCGQQLRWWFEDRTKDGHPDLVIETFEFAGECGDPPRSWKRFTGCEEAGRPEPDAAAPADHPECERRNDEIELRRAYDPGQDAWLAT